jgi:hypothetical protein
MADRPTQTLFETLGPKSIPSKPKIVVLGATGKIGRHVVKQLLEMRGVDMTIVAFVRNYDKAVSVLYDDVLVVPSGSSPDNSHSNQYKRGPKLQIVEGDLVPPEELPGFVEEETEDEIIWKEAAESTSKFYGTKVKDYDNRELLPDVNESLEEAIRDATTIISCVGDVRPTNIWTDILARPFVRLLKADVSGWCKDGRHPYYVHYLATRKALGYAEREQLRREAAATAVAEAEGVDLNDIFVPRIRFIRISDLCVGHNPWDIVPLVTNIIHSIVFRYQEMAERILEENNFVETVILRPGDLADEERDVNTTYVQVSSSGRVPGPSRVGREDVATLAVAAATFVTPNKTDETGKTVKTNEPFHYTFGCRWVGQDLAPYPPQGRKGDGHPDAAVAFRRSLKTILRNEQSVKRRKGGPNNKSSVDIYQRSSNDIITRIAQNRNGRRPPKPHGICVAVTVYLFLGLLFKTVLIPSLSYIPAGPEYILPALYQMNRWLTLGYSFLMQRLLSILPWIGRRKQVYISF